MSKEKKKMEIGLMHFQALIPIVMQHESEIRVLLWNLVVLERLRQDSKENIKRMGFESHNKTNHILSEEITCRRLVKSNSHALSKNQGFNSIIILQLIKKSKAQLYSQHYVHHMCITSKINIVDFQIKPKQQILTNPTVRVLITY